MKLTLTKNEEDYLKALFRLTIESESGNAGTNQLAELLGVSPASVSSMLKKLKTKALVSYEKYGKLELSREGELVALQLVRKHRLWETFLYRHMNFTWDEVHEVAEQLEHIESEKLIQELDKFLGFPKIDPHGDAIPDQSGVFNSVKNPTLSDLLAGQVCRLVSVKDSSAAFLKYVSELGLALSSVVEVKEVREFDGSLMIRFDGKEENISKRFADLVFVELIDND